MKQPRIIHINGKRWFDRRNGNTYHSVKAWADGALVFDCPFAYGYEEAYQETATDWLTANGYLEGREEYRNGCHEPFWQYAERKGIKYAFDVADVGRKADL